MDIETAATTLAPPAPSGTLDAESKPRIDSLALAGFVVSLVGLFLFGVLLGPVAFVLAAVGYRKVTHSGGMLAGRGLAIAGMIIGVIDTAAGIYLLRLLLS